MVEKAFNKKEEKDVSLKSRDGDAKREKYISKLMSPRLWAILWLTLCTIQTWNRI